MTNDLFQYIILGLTYLGLGLGYFPGLRMNRATIAFVGAACLVGFGSFSLKEAWEAIDAGTIVFLLSIMIVNAYLTSAGFFQLALNILLRYTRSPFGLLTALTFVSGFLSALFLNDTIALIFTPLTLALALVLELNPIPYLLALAGATDIGSVATLNGNPQNILIASFSEISYLEFTQALAPVAVVGLLVQLGWLWYLYPEIRSLKPILDRPHIRRRRILKPVLYKSLIITGGMLIAFLLGAPLAESALVASGLLLITRRLKPQKILPAVEWDLLLMFSGLFVLTNGVKNLKFLQSFTVLTDSNAGLLSVTVVLSNLISNVPAVLLLQPLIPQNSDREWLLLAAGSTLAGNMTLLGSVANMIVAEAAAKQGYRLSFWEHLRFGLPLSLVTLGIAYIWLQQ
ncbi:MAG: putative transporter [Chroococcidiopsis cubana SAG 39.79]|jgi:Na+/H+ antiporter NhaD/arsenite permease-like protein|uniref:Transporter, YbiR family n=2 Tax=Chroococcidiopsis TaxID=54298 RepID=K9U304_CHRTP|nr:MULTISPECIES: anion transporter [Chroococcidiopsis]PSB47579.1 anion transporter [Cyanosarcina cf. burmensis CCALA 770]AFY89472.1 transporter, YbiR family [Chroococcidiopsis thermalis PCC 7203]MDZ4878774.1 putative transporter [Chroococcidiopsis cubana SAG 39.79]PSB64590.1 anion transporter [Chroococcidiopsis cubana CCALA 043]RUT10838.1 anion transporter [Chroococcidiopsis cubana SAG 39.79]